jgi:hypothetical protein
MTLSCASILHRRLFVSPWGFGAGLLVDVVYPTFSPAPPAGASFLPGRSASKKFHEDGVSPPSTHWWGRAQPFRGGAYAMAATYQNRPLAPTITVRRPSTRLIATMRRI